ncbi:MAG: hypothetical protein Kow0069_20200 [Promethearchaeota archaeon]
MATPDGVWNVAEILLVPGMLGASLFFLLRYGSDKRAGVKSTASFNLGYALFFAFNALNQFSYVVYSIEELAIWPAFRTALRLPDVRISPFGLGVPLKSQILFMMACFFASFSPCVYSLERYVQNKSRHPLTWCGVVSGALCFAFWVTWYLAGVWVEAEALYYAIGLGVLFVGATFLVDVLVFVGVYLKLAKDTPGVVRKKSLVIAVGILFMYFSLVGGNMMKGEVEGWWVLVGPVALTGGILVLLYGFAKRI